MRRWAETASDVANTSRTSEKTTLLAAYLRSLDSASLPVAAVFFTGRPFPASDPRSAGVGWAAIREAAERTAGSGPGTFGEAYDRSSDPGRATFELLTDRDARPGRRGDSDTAPLGASASGPDLSEVQAAFVAIVEARRPSARVDLLAQLLGSLDPLAAMYVVRILSGELRIGLREGLVEAAVASAFGRPPADVRHALMASGDVGEVARLAAEDRLGEARPALFRPLQPMLASPARDATEIAARLGTPLWAEDKYDGIRAQLHKRGPDVRLYSRDLHDVTSQFPDVVDAARPLPWDGILDGELLAMEAGRIQPFARLQVRLGRTAPSPAVLASVPAGYVTFDAIALADQPGRPVAQMLDAPLVERRARLEALELPERIVVGHLERVGSAAALDEAFDAARTRGNEGLVVKDAASGYTLGGAGWPG